MKAFLLGVGVSTFLVVVGGFAYLRLGLAEVRADLPPSTLETTLMQVALSASVRRNARQIPSADQPSDENLIAGGKSYLNDCAGCHGAPGKTPKFPSGMVPSPRQFPTEGTEYSAAQVFWIAKNGIRRSGMFVFGFGMADAELWNISTFVKHMDHLPPSVKQKLSK